MWYKHVNLYHLYLLVQMHGVQLKAVPQLVVPLVPPASPEKEEIDLCGPALQVASLEILNIPSSSSAVPIAYHTSLKAGTERSIARVRDKNTSHIFLTIVVEQA